MPKYERHPWLEGSDHPRNCDRRQSVFGRHLCQFVHGLSFQKWPQFEATSCANSAKKEQSRAGAIKSAQDQNARGIRLFRPQIQKSPQIKDLRVYVRGGRRGIRTLDALNGHAAFPGRYNQPLCHPSAVSVFTDQILCSPESENAHYAHSFAIVQEIYR